MTGLIVALVQAGISDWETLLSSSLTFRWRRVWIAGRHNRSSELQHVLIVDDDAKIRNLIMDYLSQHAFKVSGAGNSREMTRIIAAESVDVLVVDLNLGREDGLEVVRNFSANSDAAIIIITGDRLDEADKVVGLELGASDYITKPFGMREFVARLKASIRQKPVVNASRDNGTYFFAGWSLSMRYRRLTNTSDLGA